MREMAKAMLRFSWAMSVFGLEQAGKLVKDENEGHREEDIKKAFDSLSAATSRQLGGRTKSMFEAGDRLQAESVDLLFDLARSESWKPEKVMDKTADLVERSAEALRDVAHPKTEESSAAAEPEGPAKREASKRASRS